MKLEQENARIYLRSWQLSDAEQLYHYAKNPRIALPAGWPPHQSIEDSLFILKEVLCSWGFFAIIKKDTDTLIGYICLLIGDASNFDIGEQDGELGFWMGEEFWGKGYTKEAIETLLDYSFLDLCLDRIWCGYFSDNMQSKRLQEKCGFSYAYTIDQVQTLLGTEKKEIVMNMDYSQYIENVEQGILL